MMDWIQFTIMIISFVGLFAWNRSESRADWRHMDSKIDEYRKETLDLIKAIQQEIKDFHQRLCDIEERTKK